MDGKTMLELLRELLNEDSTSGFVNDKVSYHYIWEAARDFVTRTNILKSTQSITTVAEQEGYTLNADFSELYMRNTDENNFIIKYNDGSTNQWPEWKDYNDILYEDNTSSVAIPDFFTIIDDSSVDSQATGTCTTAGALSAGESTLTDSAGDFSDVSAGDIVHNTTDSADGIVLSKTSSTALVTAMFGGTDNDWDSSDAYVIQPKGRKKLILSPPPSTASHTITLYYIPDPDPVFSDYGIYRFPQKYMPIIVRYAAWLYKYRDRQPEFGNAWFVQYDQLIRSINANIASSMNRNTLPVSFRSR